MIPTSLKRVSSRLQNKNNKKPKEKAQPDQPDSDEELEALCRQIESAQAPEGVTTSSAAAAASGAKAASHAAQRSTLLAADPKHLRAEVRPAVKALLSVCIMPTSAAAGAAVLARTHHSHTHLHIHTRLMHTLSPPSHIGTRSLDPPSPRTRTQHYSLNSTGLSRWRPGRSANTQEELKRIFGRHVVKSERTERARAAPQQQGRGGPAAARAHKRTLLVTPREHWPRVTAGLSMELVGGTGATKAFRYTHALTYLHAQQQYEDCLQVTESCR